MRHFIYNFLNNCKVELFIIFVILLNVVLSVASSFANFAQTYDSLLWGFELFSVVIFTIEYLLTLFVAPLIYPSSKHPYLQYLFSFDGVVSFLATSPFYVGFVLSSTIDLRALRVLRLFRLFRVLKLGAYSKAINNILIVIKNKKAELWSTVLIIGFLIFIGAFLIYSVESPVQPEEFSNMLDAVYWAISTVTFIYYNDSHPITHIGKILGGLISLLGMLMVALPMGIVCAGFEQGFSKEEEEKVCPHCGKVIKDA